MQLLAVLFINNCKNTLHVSDAFWAHHQEYSKSHWAPVDVTTVFSTPDDWRRKRPKHVECSCSC